MFNNNFRNAYIKYKNKKKTIVLNFLFYHINCNIIIINIINNIKEYNIIYRITKILTTK